MVIKSHRTLRPLAQWGLMLAVFSVQATVLAAESAIIDSKSRSHPVHGSLGMVVSQEIVASRVGADILSQGGNAIDAAVATGFALAVTLPRAGNLAGGGSIAPQGTI